MKKLELTEQEALDLYQTLVMLMKQLDESGQERDSNFSDRLEKIADKIK